jgi:dTDP-4-dehydrorhamnose reductase
MYQKSDKEISVTSKIKYDKNDYYSKNKELGEKLIKSKIKNYVIYRIPFILGDLKRNKSIYLYQNNQEIEVISVEDLAYGLVKTIEHKDKLNKKVKLLSGGKSCRINSTLLYIYILKIYGLSFNFLTSKLINTFSYPGNIYKEDKNLNQELKYQNDSIDSYMMRLKRNKIIKMRNLKRLMAKPFIKVLERKNVL